MFLYRYLSIYKIALFNLFVSALILMWNNAVFNISVNIFCCLVNLFFLAVALYNIRRFIKKNQERLFIGRKRTLVVAMCGVFFTVHLLSLKINFVNHYLLLIDFICSLAAVMIRIYENRVSAFLHKILRKGRRVAVVGYNDNSLQIAEKLKRKGKDFFYGHIDIQQDKAVQPASLSPYIDFAKKNRINEFYLSLADNNETEINTLIEQAEKHCIRVNIVPPQNLENPGYQVKYISGVPVLKKYYEPLTRLRNQSAKRFFDILVSGFVVLFILSWLVPLIGLLIKLESKGPVFFRQERSGINNTSFVCLKFRSMRMNEHSDLKQATKNDMRITKIGAFLRKTSIDELPQFLNVFKGDMSIVGPRPHMLRHTEEYNEQVNNYMARLWLKPGLTGWAQANGYRGEIKNIELMKKRVEHDIWYMQNWTLMLDLKIMYLTFLNVIKGDVNAY